MKFLKKSIFPEPILQSDVSIFGDLVVNNSIYADSLYDKRGNGINIEELLLEDGNISNINSTKYEITPVIDISLGIAPGELQWDADLDTMSMGVAGFDNEIPLTQKLTAKVFNAAISNAPIGSVISLNGSHDGTTSFWLASASSDFETPNAQLAIVETYIADGAIGKVTLIGLIKNLNTAAWAEGTNLYLSPNPTPGTGSLTSIIPTAPDHIIWCGVVTKQHATIGEIYFAPKTPQSASVVLTTLEDLTDTDIKDPSVNETLIYDGTTWTNEQKDWKVENDLMSPTDSNVNLELGSINIAEDAGEVTLVDMEVTGTATAGTIESYSLDIDNSPVAKIYGRSNGIDGVTDRSFVVETQYQYMGDPETDGTWRFGVQGVSLVFQRRESGIWVIYQTMNP